MKFATAPAAVHVWPHRAPNDRPSPRAQGSAKCPNRYLPRRWSQGQTNTRALERRSGMFCTAIPLKTCRGVASVRLHSTGKYSPLGFCDGALRKPSTLVQHIRSARLLFLDRGERCCVSPSANVDPDGCSNVRLCVCQSHLTGCPLDKIPLFCSHTPTGRQPYLRTQKFLRCPPPPQL